MTEYVIKLKDSHVFVNRIVAQDNAVNIETGKRDEKALVFTSLSVAVHMCDVLNAGMRFSSYTVALRDTNLGNWRYTQLD